MAAGVFVALSPRCNDDAWDAALPSPTAPRFCPDVGDTSALSEGARTSAGGGYRQQSLQECGNDCRQHSLRADKQHKTSARGAAHQSKSPPVAPIYPAL